MTPPKTYAQVSFRLTPVLVGRLIDAARRAGLTRTAWASRALEAKLDEEESQRRGSPTTPD